MCIYIYESIRKAYFCRSNFAELNKGISRRNRFQTFVHNTAFGYSLFDFLKVYSIIFAIRSDLRHHISTYRIIYVNYNCDVLVLVVDLV